jgi:hypothetical protein
MESRVSAIAVAADAAARIGKHPHVDYLTEVDTDFVGGAAFTIVLANGQRFRVTVTAS